MKYRNGTLENLEQHFITEPNCGCWLWTGALDRGGYGRCGQDKAHRVSYYLFKGDIPEGLDLDHLCRVRSCVNPDHLEPVTRSINCLRGDTGKVGGNGAKTHCLQGHEYTEENTYLDSKGKRHCIKCKKLAYRRWQLTHREQIRAYKNAWYAKNKGRPLSHS